MQPPKPGGSCRAQRADVVAIRPAAATRLSSSHGAAVHGCVGGLQATGRLQGDDAQGHFTEAMFSLPEGDDNVAADARHTLATLGLAAVVEARAGGQRLVLASTRGPGLDGVEVIGEIMQDYGWELLTRGTGSPK